MTRDIYRGSACYLIGVSLPYIISAFSIQQASRNHDTNPIAVVTVNPEHEGDTFLHTN
jgi:hypothetical protein